MQLPGRSAFVIAALAALAATTGACRQAAPAPSGREALASAVSTTLPFRARLSGGFAPSNAGPTRAAGDRAPELSPDARIAIALLEKRATDHPTPAALADLGVGFLLQGDIDRAIATLADAAPQDTTPSPWSDLSAAYLVKAERAPQRRVEYLARALEAAETSLKIAKTNDALFNRALARDGLAPYTGTAAPWSEYTANEKDAAWRDAATQEATNDRPREDARDGWELRRKDLAARLAANDAMFVKDAVGLYPEAAIEFLEEELLVDERAIASATLLASAIYDITGDPMTRDEVAALRARPAAVASAHRAYTEAKTSNPNRLADARAAFKKARDLFAQAGSQYGAVAETQLADIDWRDGKFDAADSTLARLERHARARGYTTLLGRVLWLRGLVSNRQWRLTEGLAAFRESVSLFEGATEFENANSVYSNLADALRTLGEANESWTYIGRSLEALSRLRKPRSRYLVLYNAALFSSRLNLSEAALLFQDAAVREAAIAGPAVLTEATTQRALAYIKRGDRASALRDLERADNLIASAPAGAFRSYAGAELSIVRAQLNDRGATTADLTGAIEFFGRTEPGRLPSLYLLLARNLQRNGAPTAAEEALRSGIDALEGQQARLGDDTLRISFFDESWSLFRDMVLLQLTANQPRQAFEYAERSRARALLATAQGGSRSRTLSLNEIQAQLPPSVVLLHYTTLPDRVLIWKITSSNATLIERPIAEAELGRLIEQHRESIRARVDRAANDRLYELLAAPALTAIPSTATVVIVLDGQLQPLPFATLRDPRTRRYLIEDHALMASPSASFFIDARAAAGTSVPTSALLVGNPASSAARALPGAEAEAALAAKFYPRSEVMTGASATKERFLRDAPAFDVIHFGGHALANPEFPMLSRLVFADEGGTEQSLFAHDIAKVRFPRTKVVVLAACSTAAGAVSRGEGVVSVARPFLGGGVPLVIASQWDVDDRATQQLMLAFHRELTKSGNPVRALQAAQLMLLRSGDAGLALPESWGAFVAVGTAAP